MPRTTPWRYSPSCSFSTAAPSGSAGEEVPGENCKNAVDYFRKNDILISVPDMTAGSDYNLITSNKQHPYMLKEAAKRSFRSLLQRVLSIHIGNKCITSPIVMENILANSTGVLQFSEEKTTALTSEGVKRNYADIERCMVSIMKEIYGDDVRSKLPGGLSHLLDGMVDDSLNNKAYLLPNHTSLLPSSTRAIAVLKIYMLLFEELPKISQGNATLASSILKEAASPYMELGNQWYDIAQNDAMLSKWLNYRGGCMYRRDELSLMILHRHVTHHCMEHWNPSPAGMYTYEAVQNLLEHTFPLFLPRLQFCLMDEDLLKPLKLHKLFTSPPEPYDD